MITYHGSCHCGAVVYEAQADLTNVMTCNCSHCSRKGFVLAFIPAAQFTLKKGQENLTEYRFNKKSIAHLFCTTCGVESFARGKDEKENETVMINARCLQGVDVSTLKTTEFNGKEY